MFGLLTVLIRSDLSKDVELLVLRQENQVLRRQHDASMNASGTVVLRRLSDSVHEPGVGADAEPLSPGGE